ncbi:hypothetical protein [Bdellovibrio sp. HCB2-146]|uniref:hypothetical protein n=1 Tax=Bdellovibrio sp. HCB2-146 TaxID=3394362 RepID=UPI0039BC72DD
MRMWNGLVKSVVISTTLWSQLAWSISKEMEALVRMEVHSNAVATRSNQFTRIEHFEIPLELVEKDIAERANKGFIDSMIFERDGKKYVRWVINPEDTKWYKEVEKFLLQNNIQPVRKTHFVGYMTASRSYIVVDPKTGAEFSIKMSTDRTGGNWRDKQQTWDDAKQIRMMTDFVDQQVKTQPKLKNIILLDEPMAFGIKSIDQAMVIRSYEALKGTGKRYVPGFSIMHENFGKKLALANGNTDVAAYWERNYNRPLARALAEFFALSGMTYDSPHSQNFLVELDSKNKPTGKIVLRDFGDTYLNKEFFQAVGRNDILTAWEQSNIKQGYIPAAVGILHGNKAPSWMEMNATYDIPTKDSYNQWGKEFFFEFGQEIEKQTGVKLTASAPRRSGNYVQSALSTADGPGFAFLNLVKNGQQRDHVAGLCANLF